MVILDEVEAREDDTKKGETMLVVTRGKRGRKIKKGRNNGLGWDKGEEGEEKRVIKEKGGTMW